MGFCKPMSEEVPLINTKTISKEELDAQRENAAKVQAVLQSRYTDKPLACVITYGCQQNVADSEHIKGMLADMGYAFTDDRHKAQFILFNTCAVREHAEDRVFGNVGALKSYKAEHPDTVIALCGCMMQQQHIADRIKQSFPFVDLVFGTHVVHRLPELLLRTLTRKKRVFELPDMDGVIAEGVPVVRDDQRRAWLPIMYGCNNFCTYCIVPYVRGRERSRQACDVLAEVKQLIADGYKEITLLGQNVNSYGKDLTPRVTFSQLLRQINDLPGDFRIRFMTSHPKDCTKELLDTMAECPKVAKHLHLPFQCGNDRVLKAMNRHYNREEYLKLAHYGRQIMPELVLTSDVIVGFPGETEEEFEDTISLIEDVRYDALLTFIFSPRAGTPAAKMDDPTPKEEKNRRFDRLCAVQNRISLEIHQGYVGKTVRVLCDGRDKDLLTARTEGGRLVRFAGDDSLIGQFLDVTITGCTTWSLVGELR